MKRVYKYATGAEIPYGAKYICTQVEQQVYVNKHTETDDEIRTYSNKLVWHYFLVETDSEGNTIEPDRDEGTPNFDLNPIENDSFEKGFGDDKQCSHCSK